MIFGFLVNKARAKMPALNEGLLNNSLNLLIIFAISVIAALVLVARFSILLARFPILLSLLNSVKASTKPSPIISVALEVATFNKSILPA